MTFQNFGILPIRRLIPKDFSVLAMQLTIKHLTMLANQEKTVVHNFDFGCETQFTVSFIIPSGSHCFAFRSELFILSFCLLCFLIHLEKQQQGIPAFQCRQMQANCTGNKITMKYERKGKSGVPRGKLTTHNPLYHCRQTV